MNEMKDYTMLVDHSTESIIAKAYFEYTQDIAEGQTQLIAMTTEAVDYGSSLDDPITPLLARDKASQIATDANWLPISNIIIDLRQINIVDYLSEIISISSWNDELIEIDEESQSLYDEAMVFAGEFDEMSNIQKMYVLIENAKNAVLGFSLSDTLGKIRDTYVACVVEVSGAFGQWKGTNLADKLSLAREKITSYFPDKIESVIANSKEYIDDALLRASSSIDYVKGRIESLGLQAIADDLANALELSPSYKYTGKSPVSAFFLKALKAGFTGATTVIAAATIATIGALGSLVSATYDKVKTKIKEIVEDPFDIKVISDAKSYTVDSIAHKVLDPRGNLYLNDGDQLEWMYNSVNVGKQYHFDFHMAECFLGKGSALTWDVDNGICPSLVESDGATLIKHPDFEDVVEYVKNNLLRNHVPGTIPNWIYHILDHRIGFNLLDGPSSGQHDIGGIPNTNFELGRGFENDLGSEYDWDPMLDAMIHLSPSDTLAIIFQQGERYGMWEFPDLLLNPELGYDPGYGYPTKYWLSTLVDLGMDHVDDTSEEAVTFWRLLVLHMILDRDIALNHVPTQNLNDIDVYTYSNISSYLVDVSYGRKKLLTTYIYGHDFLDWHVREYFRDRYGDSITNRDVVIICHNLLYSTSYAALEGTFITQPFELQVKYKPIMLNRACPTGSVSMATLGSWLRNQCKYFEYVDDSATEIEFYNGFVNARKWFKLLGLYLHHIRMGSPYWTPIECSYSDLPHVKSAESTVTNRDFFMVLTGCENVPLSYVNTSLPMPTDCSDLYEDIIGALAESLYNRVLYPTSFEFIPYTTDDPSFNDARYYLQTDADNSRAFTVAVSILITAIIAITVTIILRRAIRKIKRRSKLRNEGLHFVASNEFAKNGTISSATIRKIKKSDRAQKLLNNLAVTSAAATVASPTVLPFLNEKIGAELQQSRFGSVLESIGILPTSDSIDDKINALSLRIDNLQAIIRPPVNGVL